MFKTALLLTPLFLIVALGFWFILPSKNPVLISDQKQIKTDSPDLSGLNEKIDSLENKVTNLESSNSALISALNSLNSVSVNPQTQNTTMKRSPVLIPINAGGTVNSTEWTNLTSGSITIDPADYPDYKNAYLIINLLVDVGQGTAYAQLVNTQNTLAIIPSRVSTTSYLPVTLTSGPFRLPTGLNIDTVQLYNQIPNYPATAGNSFLQITF
jgi:hypothetical protein